MHSNIARPYALAAFNFARDTKQIAAWKSFMKLAAEIAQQQDVRKLLANPMVQASQLYQVFHAVLTSQITPEQNNFLQLIAQNNRFVVLPEIEQLFNAYVDALEKTSVVRVVTAIETTNEFQMKLANALTKRTHSEVTLKCEIDPAIIAGAVVYIDGDRVIDGSVVGKLARLLETSLR
jgi:F-type H+-transporting ATPase subunit delta